MELINTFNAQNELLSTVELIRLQTSTQLDPIRQKEYAQYFTSLPIATQMASMFNLQKMTSIFWIPAPEWVFSVRLSLTESSKNN